MDDVIFSSSLMQRCLYFCFCVFCFCVFVFCLVFVFLFVLFEFYGWFIFCVHCIVTKHGENDEKWIIQDAVGGQDDEKV